MSEFELTVDGLKKFSKGEKIDIGQVFPFEEDEIQWEALSIGDGTRQTFQRPTAHSFRFVEFRLTYLGVEIGRLMAEEQDDGVISWRSVR